MYQLTDAGPWRRVFVPVCRVVIIDIRRGEAWRSFLVALVLQAIQDVESDELGQGLNCLLGLGVIADNFGP